MFAFLRLLFGSIDGAEEHAHTRNKVHAKNRKIGFSRNFCSAIYTYSTVSNKPNICILVLWAKVALALEELSSHLASRSYRRLSRLSISFTVSRGDVFMETCDSSPPVTATGESENFPSCCLSLSPQRGS